MHSKSAVSLSAFDNQIMLNEETDTETRDFPTGSEKLHHHTLFQMLIVLNTQYIG